MDFPSGSWSFGLFSLRTSSMECPESTHLHLYAFDMMVVTKSSRFDLFEVSNHYLRHVQIHGSHVVMTLVTSVMMVMTVLHR
jgi:hypothetical protein